MARQTKGSSSAKGQQYRPKKQGMQDSVNNLKPYRDGVGDKSQRQAEEIADTADKMARRKRKGDKDSQGGPKVSESNPLSYYTKYSKFAEDAARLPFALPVGAPVNETVGTIGVKYTVPGIMRLVWTPTIGVSSDFTSPINRSSTRFFTYLRSNQKASAQYDHQDITMMMLALDSAYAFHALCSRIYETANLVTPVNEYYVRALIAAQGASLDDVAANMQDFRGWINQFAYNIGQFAMPKGIALFDRHRWLCENYFLDSETQKAQTYIFVPRAFWQYDNTVATGSKLTFKPFIEPLAEGSKLQYTIAELMQYGNDLLNAIAGDEDFQYISGDIYNFYGGDTYSLPYIKEMDVIYPVYDKTVLSQIENATITSDWSTTPEVTQNPSVNEGAIILNLNPQYVNDVSYTPMNFHWDSPSPGEVIEASRLCVVVESVPEGGYKITSCGTEVVNWVDIFGINPATLKPRYNPIIAADFLIRSTDTPADLVQRMTDVLHLAQFDWAPRVAFTENVSGPAKWVGQTWDVDNFQLVPDSYMKLIHEACLWSLFEMGANRD